MATFYCVLWMPTIIHSEFEMPIKGESDLFEISDNLPKSLLEKEKDSLLWAKLSFNKDPKKNKNIIIDLYKDKKGRICLNDYRLEFVYKDHSHNGLFKYEVELPENHILFQSNEEDVDFPCDIYHKIKEFYHDHEYHHNKHGDAFLKPFVTREEINLKEENNAAIDHYFRQYGHKFLGEYKAIKRLYASISNSRKAEFFYFFRSRRYRSFFQLVSSVKGDKIYYNTLYQSCYNTLFKINEVKPGDKIEESIKEKRRIVFNIDNIVNNVASFEANISSKFTLSSSLISFWVAIGALVISLVISLVTFVVSSSLSDESSADIVNTIKQEDRQLLKEISEGLKQQEQHIKYLETKIDSITGSTHTPH